MGRLAGIRPRVRVIAGLLLALGAAAALYLLVLRSDSPPAGELSVTHPDGSQIEGLSVEKVEAADAEELAEGSEAESPVYEVSVAGQLDGRAELRFTIPSELSTEERERLLVAHRESADQMWLLSAGEIDGDEFVYPTDRFSFFQLRLPSFEIKLPGRRQIEETILGVRAEDPSCGSQPTDLRLEIDSPGNESDPLIGGCLDSDNEQPLVRVANRRSIALEVSDAEGVDLVDTSGRGLSEEFWSRINEALPGAGELIPGGGSGEIAVSDPPRTAELFVNNAAVPVDLLIAVVSRGQAREAQKQSAKLAELAKCAYRGTQASLSFGYMRNLWVECGQLMAGSTLAVGGAAIFGVAGGLYQLGDLARAPFGARASAGVLRSAAVDPVGTVCAPFMIGELTVEATIERGEASCEIAEELFPKTYRGEGEVIEPGPGEGGRLTYVFGEWRCSTGAGGAACIRGGETLQTAEDVISASVG